MLKDFANLRSTFIGPSRAKLGISFTLKHHRWAIVSPLFALIWIYLKVLSTIKWLISVAFWKWAPQFENPFTKMKKKGAFVNERAGFQRSIYIFYCCKLCRQQWETLKLLKCRLALAEFVWHPFFLCPQSRMCNHRHLPSVLLTHFCYLSSRVQEEPPPTPCLPGCGRRQTRWRGPGRLCGQLDHRGLYHGHCMLPLGTLPLLSFPEKTKICLYVFSM